MASRTGVGEGDDRTFRSSEGAQPLAVCQTTMSAGASGEADAFVLGDGQDVEGCVVLEGFMTGLSELVGMQRPSVVV